MRLRGWVEVCENSLGSQATYDVYEWSEHYDSGSVLDSFAHRADAENFAVNWALAHGRKMVTGEVEDFCAHKKAVANG